MKSTIKYNIYHIFKHAFYPQISFRFMACVARVICLCVATNIKSSLANRLMAWFVVCFKKNFGVEIYQNNIFLFLKNYF